MENPIKQIYRFNQQGGLLDKGYDDFLEISMLVEEALEALPLPKYIELGPSYMTSHKEVSRAIVECFTLGPNASKPTVADVDRLDKACDAVIIAVGSMAKLGLNPQQITRALNIVMNANLAKLSMPKDEFGKLTKPDDFVGPEVRLQQILDERN